MKSKKKLNSEKNKVRSRYVDHSRKFNDWVNSIGLEKSTLGRLIIFVEKKLDLKMLLTVFLFSYILSAIIFLDFSFQTPVRVNEVASVDIISPINLSMIDEAATEEKRTEAEEALPPVFDYDPDALEPLFSNLYKSFRELRLLLYKKKWPKSAIKREVAINAFMSNKPIFESMLHRKVTDDEFEWLIEKKFSVQIENIVRRSLSKWSNFKIVDAPLNLLPEKDSSLIIRVVKSTQEGDSFTLSKNQIISLTSKADFNFKDIRGVNRLKKYDKKHVLKFSRSLLVANITFNKKETLIRREKARESVLPVTVSVKKNQKIIDKGNVVQPIHLAIFNEIQKIKSEKRVGLITFFSSLLFVAFALIFFAYIKRFSIKRIQIGSNDMFVMGLVLILNVVVVKSFIFIADAIFGSKLGVSLPETVFIFASPFSMGPMLVGLLLTSGEIVWLFTTFLAIALSIGVDMNFSFLIVALMGGVASARGVYNCKKRNDVYIAGLKTGVINTFVILIIVLIQNVGSAHLMADLLWYIPVGMISGILSSLFTMMIIPILESSFSYTTDVKLLELSALNHPLMQQMVVKAPGTYHHSLVVGSMVEAAAKKIGANSLLGKVMAYYHDIGKMEHAQYFIENQRGAQNPHDYLSPYMSKTVLVAHVKDGAELGLKYKLGKPIIDGILQHHGTSVIPYFFNKAVKAGDTQATEEDFRYPGPKPQFKEAALVMIADSIEATARSLSEPTSSRLQKVVIDTIKNKFLDGQLDECDLTLKDLSIIEESFERIILGIYHQRLDYPSGPATDGGKVTSLKSSKSNFTA